MSSSSINKILIITWAVLFIAPFLLFVFGSWLRLPIQFQLVQITNILFIANEVLASVGVLLSIYLAIRKEPFITTLLISLGIGALPFLLNWYVYSSIYLP